MPLDDLESGHWVGTAGLGGLCDIVGREEIKRQSQDEQKQTICSFFFLSAASCSSAELNMLRFDSTPNRWIQGASNSANNMSSTPRQPFNALSCFKSTWNESVSVRQSLKTDTGKSTQASKPGEITKLPGSHRATTSTYPPFTATHYTCVKILHTVHTKRLQRNWLYYLSYVYFTPSSKISYGTFLTKWGHFYSLWTFTRTQKNNWKALLVNIHRDAKRNLKGTAIDPKTGKIWSESERTSEAVLLMCTVLYVFSIIQILAISR